MIKTAGQKAVETKGLGELKREGRMAAWTRKNGKDDSRNPFSKQNYSFAPNIDRELELDAMSADQAGAFDTNSDEDARDFVLRRINLRRGQPSFRYALLRAYGGRCAISDCDCEDALEAAHIRPYRGPDTHHVQNGILLRGDIHTLFDLGKIGIRPDTYEVVVAHTIRKTLYGDLHGKTARVPCQVHKRPHGVVLQEHLERWSLL